MQKNEVQNAENGSKKTGKFMMRTDEVKIKLPEQDANVRVEYFSSLLMASAARMPGRAVIWLCRVVVHEVPLPR